MNKLLILITLLNLEIYSMGQGREQATIGWISPSSNAWLTGSNWSSGHVPSGTDIAQFTNYPSPNPAAIGINTNGIQEVGAIEITSARPYNFSIGNNGSNNTLGELQFNGATVNNISNVILRNYSSKLLTLKDLQGSSNSILKIKLYKETNIINIDGSGGITISSMITGDNINLTKAGSGSGVLTLENPASDYTGTTTITHGELRLNPSDTNTTFLFQIVLNSGTLSTTGIAARTVITIKSTLKLDSASVISLGSNSHSLKFDPSNNIAWKGTTLTINGWTGTAGSSGTAGKIFIGLNSNGLMPSQLAIINFTGFSPGAQILNTGEIVPISQYGLQIYYSKGSLPPNLTTSWNSDRNGINGTAPPNFTSGAVFIIQNSHNMTTSAAWSISGTSSKLQIENGGKLTANHAVALSSATTFQIDNGGTYLHNNTATAEIFSGIENFALNSTVEIKNWPGTLPAIPSITGTWGNLIITFNPGAPWNQTGNITNIAGSFTIDNSSGNTFSFTGDSGLTLTINGDLNIISGSLNFSNAGVTANTFIMNLGGSYNQTGGIFTPNVNASSTLLINLTGQGKTFTHSTGILTNTQIDWTINAGASYIFNNDLNIATGRTFSVNGSLDCGIKSIDGSGAFNLSSGATLKTANTAGINGSISVSGTKTLNPGANYIFEGNTAQVTGTLLPAISNNFTVDNDAGLRLSNTSLTVNGTLTINNGKLYIIESGKQMTVSGITILNGPQCLILKSDISGTASFIDHGITGPGTVKVERYLSPDAWHYISSPISNATANVFFGDYLMTSDPSSSSGWGGWIIDTSTQLDVMRGYACWKPTGNSNSEAFTGDLNTGDQTFIVNNNNGSGTFAGWHLVGNPYSSAVDLSANIDWGTFEHTAYFWNQSHTNPDPYPGGGNYDVYPASGNWGTHDQYAPAMQGFYIHNPSGNTSFTISSSARVHSGSVFLKNAKTTKNGLLITAISETNNYTDKISMHFDPDATPGYDPGFDGYKLWGLGEAPQLYTRIDNLNVTCNSLPFDKKNMVIPMGFRCNVNGLYRLIADSIGTFDDAITIWLEDRKMNIMSDLKLNPTYTFIYDTLDNDDRFLLHFDDATFGEKDSNQIIPVQIYSFGDAIYIRSGETDLKEAMVFVYDLSGKQCFHEVLSGRLLNKIIPRVAEGVYMVRLITGECSYNAKVFLEGSF
jgi:hypothetical protein